METAVAGKKIRQCPECGVKLTRYEWSKLWWMSGLMSGRLVQPCSECGARLRMSSMALVSAIASIGLIVTAAVYLFFYRDETLLFVALGLLLVILVAMMATRIEAVPAAPTGAEPAKPDRISKKRM